MRFTKLQFPLAPAAKPKNAPPQVEDSRAADRKWSRSYFGRLGRLLIVEAGWRPIVKIFARPEIKGIERLNKIPKGSPVIFTANHRSHADTPILLTSIPEPWRHKIVVCAAKDYFFDTNFKAGFFSLAIGAIPIERNKLDRASGELAGELLEKGWSLIIYPEGGRSPDGWGQPFRGGAAYLASKYQVPVLPIYLEGTRNVIHRGKSIPNITNTMLIFGDPIFPTPEISTRALGKEISDATDSLADEISTDWWSATQRKHQGKSPSTHGPNTASWIRTWKLPTTEKSAQDKLRRTAKNPWS